MLGPYYLTTDAKRRAALGDPCGVVATAASVTIDGRTFRCRREAVEPFEAFETIRAHHGYRLTGTDTGIYSCRRQQHNPDKPMSFHAWGMVLDVNWLENPAGNKLVTDLPQAMINDLLAVRTNSGARVFRWGADWDWDGDTTDHNYVDAMHWEIVAHPRDLATGIAPLDLSPRGTTSTPEKDEDMTVAEFIQECLVDAGFDIGTSGPNGDGIDRDLGPKTKAALVAALSDSKRLREKLRSV